MKHLLNSDSTKTIESAVKFKAQRDAGFNNKTKFRKRCNKLYRYCVMHTILRPCEITTMSLTPNKYVIFK